MQIITRFTSLLLSLGLLSALVSAQALGPDLANGQDHPILTRFTGSQLIGYQQLDFDSGHFFLTSSEEGFAPNKELDLASPINMEGRVTRLLYIAPAGKTPLEVQRNFEQALATANWQAITTVDGRDSWWSTAQVVRKFSELAFLPPFASDILPFERGNGFYSYGTINRAGTEVGISIMTAPVSLFVRDLYQTPETTAQAAVAVQIIEPVIMTQGQVTASAEAIATGLATEGRIALYGIQFDTGEAEIKTDAQEQLAQMAQILSAQPQLRVHVVGHTDNIGNLTSNLALSQRRAEAVVAALVSNYGIEAQRLTAQGVASLAPLASNQSEAGRALNRRVELVEQ